MATAHSVSLSWVASVDAVSGYNVYRGSVKGGENVLLTPSPIAELVFTDTTAVAGNNFYVVKSVENGVESPVSNEVEAVLLPAPPTDLVITASN